MIIGKVVTQYPELEAHRQINWSYIIHVIKKVNLFFCFRNQLSSTIDLCDFLLTANLADHSFWFKIQVILKTCYLKTIVRALLYILTSNCWAVYPVKYRKIIFDTLNCNKFLLLSIFCRWYLKSEKITCSPLLSPLLPRNSNMPTVFGKKNASGYEQLHVKNHNDKPVANSYSFLAVVDCMRDA